MKLSLLLATANTISINSYINVSEAPLAEASASAEALNATNTTKKTKSEIREEWAAKL